MADKVFELTVCSLNYEDNSAKDAVFDCADEKGLDIIVGKSRNGVVVTAAVSGILVSVELNKRIGTHNSIKARLKIVQQTSVTDTTPKLNVSLLKNAFLRREVRLNVIVDDKSHAIAEKYYVFGVKPKYNKDGATYYLDLNIYSWDKLMDITKHSKSYARMRLGGDILNGFMESYKKKYESLKLSDCQTSGMRVMVSKSDDSSNGNKNEEPVELAFPVLEQYDETDYNFLLRNANKCGEFFYFENGTLNLGLTRVMKETNGTKQEVVTKIDETSYASIESLSDEINDDEVLESFGEEDAGFKLSANKPEPVYDYNATNGKPEEPDKDDYDEWGCVYAPWWSRALAHFFQYTTIADFLIEWGEDEYSVTEYRNAMSKSFNDNVRNPYIESLKSKPEGGDQVNSKGKKVYCKYAIDDVLFKTMDKAKLNVSDNQYRITFDDGQMNLKLGDIVSCSGIGSGGRFVVVDVHSVFEKEDVVADARIVNRMEVTVIPVYNNIPIPLPADAGLKSFGNLRDGSNTYTGSTSTGPIVQVRKATVYVSDDPYRRNQVQVTYDGDDNPSAEWVKVLTPFASNEIGISCKLVEGDNVLVCSITDTNNITESFVVGSYYDKDRTPPTGQRKFSSIITSKNGQYIGFEESKSLTSFLTGFIPGLNLLKWPIGGVAAMFGGDLFSKLSSWTADEDSGAFKALGGIEMSDAYGFFTIAASSSKRSITISSPFGTVGIDAAMGITISAPNGDIKIVGKNIDIEAGNNLTLKSGTNIDSSYYKDSKNAVFTGKNFYNALSNLGNSVSNAILDLFDLPALRFVAELLIKPIAGTLKIHSGRNLLLEADGTEASLTLPSFIKEKKLSGLEEETDAEKGSEGLDSKITNLTTNVKAYITSIIEKYIELKRNRETLVSNWSKFYPADSTQNVDSILNSWLENGENVSSDEFDSKLKKNNNDLIGDSSENANDSGKKIEDLNKLITGFKTFWNKDYGKMESIDNQYFEELSGKRVLDKSEVRHFKGQPDNELELVLFDFKEKSKNKILRSWILDEIGVYFEYDNMVDIGNDENWKKVINSIKYKRNSLTTYAFNMLKKMAKNLLPFESLNTLYWDKEQKGQILISQHDDSTLSINGQTFKRNLDDTSLAKVKDAMRNATL